MLNHLDLIGIIVTHPILNKDKNAVSQTSFRLAVRRSKKNAKGEFENDYIDVSAWKNQAEFICERYKKGDPIVLHGHLQSRLRELTDGKAYNMLEVICDSIEHQDSLSLKEGYGYRGAQNVGSQDREEET